MNLDNTTALVKWIWPLCKIRWISAFSIVLLIQLYRGSYRKPFQSWGTGTSEVSINHPMDGFPYLQFSFHLLLTTSQRQGQSWQSVCHYGSKCYEFVNLWNPTAITSAWISIFRDASSGTTIDSGHYTLLPSSSKGKDYFCPFFNVLPISASVRGTLLYHIKMLWFSIFQGIMPFQFHSDWQSLEVVSLSLGHKTSCVLHLLFVATIFPVQIY